MSYSPAISKVLASISHNSGAVFEAVGVDANFSCGCFIRFGISIDPNGRTVSAAGFESNGCGYMIAAAEIAARSLECRGLTDLRGDCSAIVDARVTDALAGELPDARRGCSGAVAKAASNAFARQREQRVAEFRGETALICTCFSVTEDAIRGVIRDKDQRSVASVGEATNAGTGCGSCQILIREILDEPEG